MRQIGIYLSYPFELEDDLEVRSPLRPVFWAGIAIALIYGPWLWNGTFVRWDLNMVAEPLLGIRSLGDYFSALGTPRLWDLQPVRDFSYFVDFQLAGVFGPRVFQLSNILIFAGILFWVRRVLRRASSSMKGPGAKAAEWGIVFLAAHPAIVSSVCWIAARKHLLSCFFILGATDSFLALLQKKPASRWARGWPVVGYLLSVFSQPITLLWPVWAWLHSRSENSAARTRVRGIIVATGVLAIFVAVANSRYYANSYSAQSGVAKWVPFDWSTLGVGFLAQGRYFLDCIWPFGISPLYGVFSVANGVGLLLAILFFGFSAREFGARACASWTAFYLLPLLVVTFPMTHVFALDSYLLTPLVGFWVLATRWAETRIQTRTQSKTFTRSAIRGWLVIAASLTIASAWGTVDWRSDTRLWTRVLSERDSEFVRVKLADAWYREGDFARARLAANEIAARFPESEDVPLLFARSVYSDRLLKSADKVHLLQSTPHRNEWTAYYLASVFAGEGRFQEAADVMLPVLMGAKTRFGSELPMIVAEAEAFCARAGSTRCEGLKAHVKSMSAADPRIQWNESAYLRRSMELTR